MTALADLAIQYPLLAFAALCAVVVAICYGLAELFDRIDNRLELRRDIRHIEDYANHPANRSPRKEDR